MDTYQSILIGTRLVSSTETQGIQATITYFSFVIIFFIFIRKKDIF